MCYSQQSCLRPQSPPLCAYLLSPVSVTRRWRCRKLHGLQQGGDVVASPERNVEPAGESRHGRGAVLQREGESRFPQALRVIQGARAQVQLWPWGEEELGIGSRIGNQGNK